MIDFGKPHFLSSDYVFLPTHTLVLIYIKVVKWFAKINHHDICTFYMIEIILSCVTFTYL